ncbi:HlyD family secretion protein [Candidatus Galacturonibacter soehngenii]|uniref:HlyD family efflux transporter periplasmic adaptor subunit n=1 Tax=Candidatus Galacturonatibacter soehngenii TaxID=2307010 RepID=A0A7V7QLS5_9FIRM|nr:HlyD family efflux transporter periplasmic adaptor subunit [Candidatus Galacturonibacter soehngenii]KAB1439496.1 HlyD family efflux transporter periplasmic adaptor subunit [Candidatus Galacturonibacter soehngenii]
MIKLKQIHKKKKIIYLGIVILVTAGIIIGWNQSAKGKSGETTQIPISVESLTKKDLSKVIGVSGVVESENVSKITTSITSKVKELNIHPGDKVNEGDMLCVFDDETIKAEIKKLEESIAKNKKLDEYQAGMNQRALTNAKEEQSRQVDKANSNISQAQSDLDSASNHVSECEDKINSIRDEIKSTKKKIKKLKEKKKTLKSEENEEKIQKIESQIVELKANLDSLEANYTEAESELASLRESEKSAQRVVDEAQENLESVEASTSQSVQEQVDNINTSKFKTNDNDSEAQLEKLKTNLASTVINAPISGTITYLNLEKGSPASEGVIMKIEDTDSLKISVRIKEYDILNIKEGMKAMVTCDAIPDTTMEGVVSKIYLTPIATDSNASSDSSNTREYAAEIKLNETYSNLLIGMNVKAKIVLEENKDVFAVPYESVTTNSNNEMIVYVAMDDKKGSYFVKAIPVEKGIETDYYAAISSKELEEGMFIITTPEMVSEKSTISIQPTSENIDTESSINTQQETQKEEQSNESQDSDSSGGL